MENPILSQTKGVPTKKSQMTLVPATHSGSPLHCANAPFRRLGSVLLDTVNPSKLHLWQLHCETLPSAPRRSGQRYADVPRLRSISSIYINSVNTPNPRASSAVKNLSFFF